jgi:hypothetical protein
MPRFYINFRTGDHVAVDDEGIDAPDLQDARNVAILSARELIGEAIKHGGEAPDYVIVCDESGSNLLTLSIADILPISLRGL